MPAVSPAPWRLTTKNSQYRRSRTSSSIFKGVVDCALAALTKIARPAATQIGDRISTIGLILILRAGRSERKCNEGNRLRRRVSFDPGRHNQRRILSDVFGVTSAVCRTPDNDVPFVLPHAARKN